MAAPRRKRDEARGLILDAALDLFVSDGYPATTLEQIASRVGITRGAVLYHFKSKEALLCALHTPLTDAVADWLDTVPVLTHPTHHHQRTVLRSLVDILCEHRRPTQMAYRLPPTETACGLNDLLAANEKQIMLRLVGPRGMAMPAMMMRAACAVSAVSGSMGYRYSLPLDSDEEREMLAAAAAEALRHGAPQMPPGP